jgi:hypothetical protein
MGKLNQAWATAEEMTGEMTEELATEGVATDEVPAVATEEAAEEEIGDSF